MAKFILPRQANVLLDQILDQSDNPQFLETDGLFRILGNKAEIKRAFKAFLSSPKDFDLTKQQAILASPHNVIGLLIATLSNAEKPVKFSKEALNALNSCNDKMIKISDPVENPIDEMIDVLVQTNQVEEAKLFHNLFYLAQRVLQHSDRNKMTVHNIGIALINTKFMDFAGMSASSPETSDQYFALLGKVPKFTEPLISHSQKYNIRFSQAGVSTQRVEPEPKPILIPKREAKPMVQPAPEPMPAPAPVEKPASEGFRMPPLKEISETFTTEWETAKKATGKDWRALATDFSTIGKFAKNVTSKLIDVVKGPKPKQ